MLFANVQGSITPPAWCPSPCPPLQTSVLKGRRCGAAGERLLFVWLPGQPRLSATFGMVPFTFLASVCKEQGNMQTAGNWICKLGGKKGERLQEAFPPPLCPLATGRNIWAPRWGCKEIFPLQWRIWVKIKGSYFFSSRLDLFPTEISRGEDKPMGFTLSVCSVGLEANWKWLLRRYHLGHQTPIRSEYTADERMISFPALPHKRIFSLLHMWREDGSLPWGMLLLATTSFLKAPFEKEEIVGGGSSWKGIFQILIFVSFFSGDTQYDGNNWCGCLKWWKNCRKLQRVWQQENRLILHLLYNIYHQPILYILLSFV